MPLPSKQWLDSLDALNGAPHVSYPDANRAHPRIERTFFAPLAQAATQPATLTGYAGSKLVQIEEISRDTLRVKLYVRYDTLPGPVVVRESQEPETGGPLYAASIRVALPYSAPSRGPIGPNDFGFPEGMIVLDSSVTPVGDSSLEGVLHLQLMALPDGRTETRPGTYQGPSVFASIPNYGSWPNPPAIQGAPSGPYANRADGLDANGASLPLDLNHRGTYELATMGPAKGLSATITYSVGNPGPPPAEFSVTSSNSRHFPIDRNTIHNAYTLIGSDGSGTLVLENLRASTPASYPTTPVVVGVEQAQWLGPIWKRTVLTAKLPPLPSGF